MAKKIDKNAQDLPANDQNRTMSEWRPGSTILKEKKPNIHSGHAAMMPVYILVASMILILIILITIAIFSVKSIDFINVNIGYMIGLVVILLVSFVLFEVAMKPNLYVLKHLEEDIDTDENPKEDDGKNEEKNDNPKLGDKTTLQSNVENQTPLVSDILVKKVVTSILINDGKILVMKRSNAVGTYQGLWAGVSGHLEKNEKPEDRALIEIEEETGIRRENVLIIKKGDIVNTRDGPIKWVVQPFLVKTEQTEIKIDWEHTEYKWISPEELETLDTVPNFKTVVKRMIT